jgi:hypothetical protein
MSERSSDIVRRINAAIGIGGWIEAVLYPALTPLFVAAAWIRSLWAARLLLNGRWSRYQGFHPLNALTSFFYKTQWLNFERFGRHGISPLLGLGNYPLNRWFHLTLLSSCLYANAGAVSTLLGTLVWVGFHWVWLDSVGAAWVLPTVLVLWCSSTAYAMAFTRQNYNILGWMWLPLALYAASTGHWTLASLAWLAASLASITVIFAAVPLMAAQAWQAGSPDPLLALVPALLKLVSHLLPLLTAGGLRPALLDVAKMIGMTASGVRYKRRSMHLRPFTVYFIAIYAVGCGMLWADHGVPLLPVMALALVVVNQVIVRFADEQSVIVMFVSVFGSELLASQPSIWALMALAVVANPMPVFLDLCAPKRDRSVVRVQVRPPFDHTRLQWGLDEFLSAVPAGNRVLFAFDEPAGVYENIFDGYRSLIELPLFVAATRGVHLFPDWYAVAETNYLGAPNCWGRSVQQVRDLASVWSASHAIVYHDSGDDLDPSWSLAGFRQVARFDWGEWIHELDGIVLWRAAKPPCWRLLAVPDYRL